jgi:hypothetical protein
MKSYTERLAWAIKCAGFDPTRDQSRIAALIGKPCKPQNIQHLLNPDNAVEHSKYTLDLAQVLGCDPFWLGKGIGIQPTLMEGVTAAISYQYNPSSAVPMVASPPPPVYLWPFKSFTFQEYDRLAPEIKQSFENVIAASIVNRSDTEKQEAPANTPANVRSA